MPAKVFTRRTWGDEIDVATEHHARSVETIGPGDSTGAILLSLDLTATGETILWTADEDALIYWIDLIVRTASGAQTVLPVVGVGVASGASDIIAPTALRTFTTVNAHRNLASIGFNSALVEKNDAVVLGVDTASDMTTLTVDVWMSGMLVG